MARAPSSPSCGRCWKRPGCVVHVYTSPHLVRFSERIVVAGREIGDAALMALLEECERANAGRPITVFEITTAAALLAFARTPADVTLLETGLGGRLDATNVVAAPALTVHHADFARSPELPRRHPRRHRLREGGDPQAAACPASWRRSPRRRGSDPRPRRSRWDRRSIEQGSDWRAAPAAEGSLLFHVEDKVLTLPPPGLVGLAPSAERRGCRCLRAASAGGPAAAGRVVSISAGATRSGSERRRRGWMRAAIARGIETVRWPARLQRLAPRRAGGAAARRLGAVARWRP